jgi:hypothetical protein
MGQQSQKIITIDLQTENDSYCIYQVSLNWYQMTIDITKKYSIQYEFSLVYNDQVLI